MHTFDKLDGSNIRCEWSNKQGWYKFGSRKQLIDKNDPLLSEAINILLFTNLSYTMSCICKENKWERIVAFFEFYGEHSFAGQHVEQDPKRLTLIDVSVYKQGFLSVKDFLKIFEGNVDIPKYFGKYDWNSSFAKKVRDGNFEYPLKEGLVGKKDYSSKHDNPLMYKVKTQEWIDKVFARYLEKDAMRILKGDI